MGSHPDNEISIQREKAKRLHNLESLKEIDPWGSRGLIDIPDFSKQKNLNV
ncbi:hypothetical protein Fmac_023839 [Flemingia macrophylla]|uniref:Uncharacterized protein n=1 Tax=Flemingia macrophylla TaxID=520843 RepID=A0ABD1LMQ8_9FABA